MSKIFISDLHISSPLFKKEKEVIELFNDPIIEEIYILGDLFDTWDEDPFITTNRYPELIKVIEEKATILIKGNHDPSISILKLIFPNLPILMSHRMELFGKDTLLVHGDSVDDVKDWSQILYIFQVISAHFGFDLKSFVTQSIVDFTKRKYNLTNNDLILKMEKAIVKKHKDECEILITGHTHFPKIVMSPEVLFANCGSVIYKPSYLVAESNILRIERL